MPQQPSDHGISFFPSGALADGDKNGSRKEWANWEDAVIIELVRQHGNKAWAIVAAALPQRTGKQCRERWHNHLDPAINKGEWTEEEDMRLIDAHRAMGNRWADIAKAIAGRTDNQIKNRWNSALRRELRKLNRLASKQGVLSDAMAAATAAVAAAAGSSELKDHGPDTGLATSSPDTLACSTADVQLGTKRKRQYHPAHINATRALIKQTSMASTLKLDTSRPLPPGTTEVDQRHAAELLAHVSELNATWKAAPDTHGDELSEPALKAVAHHVEWLHSFCRQLVEQSLISQRQPKAPEEETGKRKRRRKPAATKVAASPLAVAVPPPAMANVQALHVTQPVLAHAAVAHQAPMTSYDAGAMAPQRILPTPYTQPPQEGVVLNVDELLHLVGNQDAMRAVVTSPRGMPLISLAAQPAPQYYRGPMSPVSPVSPVGTGFDSHFGAGYAQPVAVCPASPTAIMSPREFFQFDSLSPQRVSRAVGANFNAVDHTGANRTATASYPAYEECIDRIDPSTAALIRHDTMGAGVGARRRPDGMSNLSLNCCSPGPSDASLGSAGSGTTEPLNTARLAALISPSLLSPSFFDMLEPRAMGPPSLASPSRCAGAEYPSVVCS